MSLERILHVPSLTSLGRDTKHVLIYFITGNPGYIGYYHDFLGTLNTLLSSSSSFSPHKTSPIAYTIMGRSLLGFDSNDHSEASPRKTPYGLEEIITDTYSQIRDQKIKEGERHDQDFDTVILVGHSVGSYIALECLHRSQISSKPHNITAAICLFPTVTHIAQSPSGVKMSKLCMIPQFPWLASRVVRALVWAVPEGALRWVVKLVTGMGEAAAGVTAAFVGGRMGVWQALHMARDEMNIITEDKWDEEIWGVENPENEDGKDGKKIPTLVFYFGQNDHWVADHTRDALIAARCKNASAVNSSSPRMMIDENGVPHGFCIHHSEIIAEKVKVCVEEIVESTIEA